MTSGLHRLLRSACSKQSTQFFTPADEEKNITTLVYVNLKIILTD